MNKIPTAALIARGQEIVATIGAGDYGQSLLRECTMSIPARPDRDADLVFTEIMQRLERAEARLAQIEAG